MDHYIALNRDAAAIYSSQFPSMVIDVVPNFAPLPEVSKPTLDPRIRSGFVFAGRLTPEKGIKWLLEHWPSGEPLTIYGDGPLKGLVAAAANTAHSGISFKGQIPQADLAKAVARAEALILPSLWREGKPTVMLEALASGTPVLLSNAVAEGDLLEAAGAGITFEAGVSSSSLVHAIDALRAGASGFISRARHLYESEYSEQIWLERIGGVYERARTKARLRAIR
ncbi:glycosyltransferase family 4 protein [Blastococcus brunescens]|uniref:Glycosyltransferase family 4 protein n=1 Tax=Blastococcus brunescens TaxID=1564165 RepID=A0ABZ1B0E2_9ACTN|nr:glycosyltransferase family 4 protein [Blastococcus sp. BMG 8361]WRL64287.1 glycosyltransferase family 4 protein [Blastococcus sp. BMG 8361]